jgi:phosphoglucomutase
MKTERPIDYLENYKRWCDDPAVDAATRAEAEAVTDDAERRERFGKYMEFGTAGLRAKMGVGTAEMNVYTVAHATEGLARLILKTPDGARRGVAICYDSRRHSEEFARRAAQVLSADRIRVYLFPALRPTPMLSFAVRHLGCIAGINITASHNPAEYNGYKVYWEDGGQLPPAHADTVLAEIRAVDIFRDVPAPKDADPALITMTDASLDAAYKACVLAELADPDAIPAVADSMAVVYTPLHGTGGTVIPDVLRAAGLRRLYPVQEQMDPDGDSPPVHSPNPEFPEAFALG